MALSAATLAGYYYRLHQKIHASESLFDPSWECDDGPGSNRIRWVTDCFGLTGSNDLVNITFEHFVERLLLLTPLEIRKLLCGLGALTAPGHLRHCIDGTFLRDLKTTVGPSAYNILLQRRDLDDAKLVAVKWSIDALCSDGLAQVQAQAQATSGLAVPINLVIMSLPKRLVSNGRITVPSVGKIPLSQLKALFPELRWLFG